jgi:hypothetical protein
MDTSAQPVTPAIDPAALAEVQGTKPWLRFLSVLGFIGAAICVLAAFGMAAVGLLGKERPILMFGLAAMYVFNAVAYLITSLYLHWAANAAAEAIDRPTPDNLTAFLSCNRRFWKLIGILAIATLALYILAIAAAIALPIIQKLKNS